MKEVKGKKGVAREAKCTVGGAAKAMTTLGVGDHNSLCVARWPETGNEYIGINITCILSILSENSLDRDQQKKTHFD